MVTDHFSKEGALMAVSAIWGQVMVAIFSFDIFTGEIENSFEKLKGLKTPIQERLLHCPGEVEKAQMNYLLQKIEDVKPMNACGYFDIGKSTLTSMLSVRLEKYLILLKIYTFNFHSLTYIIILVQFKMTQDGCNCDHSISANITYI